MKKLILIFVLCSATVFAQKKIYKHSLQGVKKVQLISGASITVIAGNSNQLEISGIKNDNENKALAEKRKGLKAIYPGGEDTTNDFGFSINKKDNLLTVIDLKASHQRGPITITLPSSMNIDVNAGNLGGVKLDGFSSEIEVRTNVGTIDLKNVTGPITAHSSTGTIKIDFSKVNQISPISISNSVGEIDVTLPGNTKANLNLRTSGTIYTNFEFKAEPKKGLPNVSGLKRINKEINGGGVNIKLNSSLGNIYLRKK